MTSGLRFCPAKYAGITEKGLYVWDVTMYLSLPLVHMYSSELKS